MSDSVEQLFSGIETQDEIRSRLFEQYGFDASLFPDLDLSNIARDFDVVFERTEFTQDDLYYADRYNELVFVWLRHVDLINGLKGKKGLETLSYLYRNLPATVDVYAKFIVKFQWQVLVDELGREADHLSAPDDIPYLRCGLTILDEDVNVVGGVSFEIRQFLWGDRSPQEISSTLFPYIAQLKGYEGLTTIAFMYKYLSGDKKAYCESHWSSLCDKLGRQDLAVLKPHYFSHPETDSHHPLLEGESNQVNRWMRDRLLDLTPPNFSA